MRSRKMKLSLNEIIQAKMRGFTDALEAMQQASSMDAPKWLPAGSMTAFPEGREIYQRTIER